MKPTAAALQMLPVEQQSLDLIASVFRARRCRADRAAARRTSFVCGVLACSAPASFHSGHPTIRLYLRLEASRAGLRGVDAAIRYGSGKWAVLSAGQSC